MGTPMDLIYLSRSLFFFSGLHSVCTNTGSPEKRNCVCYNFYLSGIIGKIITERFVENTLLIQTIYSNVAIKKFYSEQEIKKKKKTRSGIRFNDLAHARNIIKFLIPYLGCGYLVWDIHRALQWLYYPAPTTSPPMKIGNREGAWILSGSVAVTKQFVSLTSHIQMAEITHKTHLGARLGKCSSSVPSPCDNIFWKTFDLKPM